MQRREFLRLSGRLLLASGAASALATIPGCGSGRTPRPSASPSRFRPPSPHGSPSPPTPTNWTAFAQSLNGTLIRPGSPGYHTDLQLFNPVYDGARPVAIAYCQSVSDVQRSIAFARAHGILIAPRAGGHSYAGYSTGPGMTIDVSRLSSVTVNAAAGMAMVGAGTHLIDLYSALSQHGVAVPGGSCPTVGISGLCMGGGMGVLGRRYGLTCDSLTQLQIVTAAGDVLVCNTGSNSDLFWACQGGGGGNFGIVTAFTFRVHPLTELALFYYAWPWSAAARVVAAWQSWGPTAPDELTSNCVLVSNTDRSAGAQPLLFTSGAYAGPAAQLNPLLAQLRQRAGVSPTTAQVNSHPYLDAMLIEAGCSGKTVDECHLPTENPQGTLTRQPFTAKSDYYSSPLPAAGIDAVIKAIEQRQADPRLTGSAGVAFDAYGGAINRVAPDATAFVHRNNLFSAQYNATWSTGDPQSIIDDNAAWLNGFYGAMRPYVSGYAYQNYIDPNLRDWQHAYYGSSFARLVKVKAAYDPDDVFHFAQSIPTH